MHETTSCTPVGNCVGSVGFSVDIMFSTAPQRHFYTLPPVAARAAWHRSAPICQCAGAYMDCSRVQKDGAFCVQFNQ